MNSLDFFISKLSENLDNTFVVKSVSTDDVDWKKELGSFADYFKIGVVQRVGDYFSVNSYSRNLNVCLNIAIPIDRAVHDTAIEMLETACMSIHSKTYTNGSTVVSIMYNAFNAVASVTNNGVEYIIYQYQFALVETDKLVFSANKVEIYIEGEKLNGITNVVYGVSASSDAINTSGTLDTNNLPNAINRSITIDYLLIADDETHSVLDDYAEEATKFEVSYKNGITNTLKTHTMFIAKYTDISTFGDYKKMQITLLQTKE